MTQQLMTRFVALTTEPDNPAGVATYTYAGWSFELPMASFSRARELEQFLGHVVGNARRQQREAILAQMRGAINNLEEEAAEPAADATDSRARAPLNPEKASP